MSDDELVMFLEEADKKVCNGYDIFEAQELQLETEQPLEYIHLGDDIQINKFPDIKAVPFKFYDYVAADSENLDIEKFKRFFTENVELIE